MRWEWIGTTQAGRVLVQYTEWRGPVPRIPPLISKSIVYLYADKLDAEGGSQAGASGFLLSMREFSGGPEYFYVVTNAHVIQDGFCLVRVNLRSPGDANQRTFCFPFSAESWIQHDIHDLAVRPLAPDFDLSLFDVSFLPSYELISKPQGWGGSIAPGDDLFYVGRFRDHAGKWENQPSVRFGNLSMLPNEREPIEYETPSGQIRNQVGFLVEARSRSGYSGSPVFIYQQCTVDSWPHHAWKAPAPFPPKVEMDAYPLILGVDWGHVLEEVSLTDRHNHKFAKAQVHSGMMGVVPGWYLSDFLDNDLRLKAHRERVREFRLRREAAGACD